MTSTRCGVSAKQLERELGVTYKTAWRMFNMIRNKLMTEDGEPLSGAVEIDEMSPDGRPRKHHRMATDPEARQKAMKLRERSRATVLAAVERGGRVKATVVPSRRGPHIQRQVIEWVAPSRSSTPTSGPPTTSWTHFADHSRVRHAAGEYVIGDAYTNTIEGFFGHVKPSIRGTYKKVSHRWLQGYLNEFTWRYNRGIATVIRGVHELAAHPEAAQSEDKIIGALLGRPNAASPPTESVTLRQPNCDGGSRMPLDCPSRMVGRRGFLEVAEELVTNGTVPVARGGLSVCWSFSSFGMILQG